MDPRMTAVVLANTPEWIITWRDSAVAVAAVCGALVTIAAASRLPIIRVPVRWVGRTLFGPGIEAYWGRVRHEASQAMSPQLMELAEWQGAHGALLGQTREDLAEIISRVERIEQQCSHISASTAAAAGALGAARRHDDPEPSGVDQEVPE